MVSFVSRPRKNILSLPTDSRIRDVMLTKLFKASPGPGPIKRLREGGYDTGKIKEVILSHQHFDHFGDLDTLAPGVKVVLGPGSLASIGPGYPEDPDGSWPKKWLDEKQLEELPPVDVGSSAPSIRGKWQQVACFEHALDYFGDGSLWLAVNEGASVFFHINGQTASRSLTYWPTSSIVADI